MDDMYEPGIDYPKWLSEDLIEQTIRIFAPKKKDGPFTRDEAIDLLIRLGTLLDVTGMIKVDLDEIDTEFSAELPEKKSPVPRRRTKSAQRRATRSKSPKKRRIMPCLNPSHSPASVTLRQR